MMQETPDMTSSAEAPEPAGAPAGSQADLEQRLKQAEINAQEHHDAWLRARAESDNIRKRSQTEVSNAHKYAVENFVAELIPVKDSLEAALASESAADSMRSGVELTLKQLKGAFEKFNVKEIDPAGEKFDPHRHQAISTAEAPVEPNTVVQVLQKGYLLHDRVIRPALVIVAKANH
jgi:molecular chaperone GrpE